VIIIAIALVIKKNIWVIYPHILHAVKASENLIREFNGISAVESFYN